MKSIIYIACLAGAVLLSSCNSDASLQKYYVEKQNDDAFISLDLPSSLLITENNTLSDEQLSTLKTIKKVNVLALRINEENKPLYEVEKERVNTILSDERYQPLMSYGSSRAGAALKFTGKEDAIDELIIFASDEEKGFALFRVIGNEINPSQIVKLMDGINPENFDFSALKNIGSLLN